MKCSRCGSEVFLPLITFDLTTDKGGPTITKIMGARCVMCGEQYKQDGTRHVTVGPLRREEFEK